MNISNREITIPLRFSQDALHTQRLYPPLDFVPYTEKTQKFDDEISVRICPVCGSPKTLDDAWGFRTLTSCGFADPAIHEFTHETALHWSRYILEECIVCHAVLWHGVLGDAASRSAYYSQKAQQLSLL